MSWNADWCSMIPATVTASRSFFDVLLVLCSRSAHAGAANTRTPATASARLRLMSSPSAHGPPLPQPACRHLLRGRAAPSTPAPPLLVTNLHGGGQEGNQRGPKRAG